MDDEGMMFNASFLFKCGPVLGKTAFRVMYFLLKAINHEDNCCYFSCVSIAKWLELNEKAVCRAIDKLQSVDFIRKVRDDVWMINPDVAFYYSPSLDDVDYEKVWAELPAK